MPLRQNKTRNSARQFWPLHAVLSRRMALEKFTLSAVAREADVPRNSLYGTFHNKNELLVAIAADDLPAQSVPCRAKNLWMRLRRWAMPNWWIS